MRYGDTRSIKQAWEDLIVGLLDNLASTKFKVTLFSMFVACLVAVLLWLQGADWIAYLLAVLGNLVPAVTYTIAKSYQNTHGRNDTRYLLRKLELKNINSEAKNDSKVRTQD